MPASSCPCQHWIVSFLFNFCKLYWRKWYAILNLPWLPLRTFFTLMGHLDFFFYVFSYSHPLLVEHLCFSYCSVSLYVLRIMSLVAIASSFFINCMVFGGTFKFSYSWLYCFILYFTFNIMHTNIFPTPQLYVLLYFWVPLPSLF